MGIADGKRALIVGVANDKSLAWSIAQELRAQGVSIIYISHRLGEISDLADRAVVLRDFPGEAPVLVDLEMSDGARTLKFGPSYRVQPVPDFFAEVKALLGEAAVR